MLLDKLRVLLFDKLVIGVLSFLVSLALRVIHPQDIAILGLFTRFKDHSLQLDVSEVHLVEDFRVEKL